MSAMSVKKVVLDHDEVSPDQVHKLLVVTLTLIFKVNGHFRLFSAILTPQIATIPAMSVKKSSRILTKHLLAQPACTTALTVDDTDLEFQG